MPALSPTMTEGSIASWKVKDGDSYSAGDVLLEIETDKATMDVEAQEDGVVMKIMTQEGSKAVQVGSRIAVLAETGDDISSIELPPDEQSKQAPKTESKSEDSKASRSAESQSSESPENTSGQSSSATTQKPKSFLPSVAQMIKEKKLSDADVAKIKPSGPGGRILKGDVLAYVGSINKDTPAALSARLDKLSHLDLSNIKVAEPTPAKTNKELESIASRPSKPETLEINIPISLAKVVEVQRKIHETVGVSLPMSTFINRATEYANDDLPLSAREPTTNELFNQVLGLDNIKVPRGSNGMYLPQISAIPPASVLASRAPKAKKRDIFDDLSSNRKTTQPPVVLPLVPGLSSGANVFSLVVPKAEQARAQIFLERCKLILEKEPGRLVL